MPDARQPYLSAVIRHRIGTLELDATFELTRPWTILFGPSGSGKTTILRAIAGLVPLDAGRIALDGRVLVDTTSGTSVAPYRRGTVLAPQSARLFPHLTVRENLQYGGGYKSEVAVAFGLDGLLDNLPAQLSGGEAQRVNLVRAMAAKPRLLLLDEPFTGLEVALRSSLVAHVLDWQERTHVPILSVTHDVAEALQLGAEVIRLREGRVEAQGPAAQVLAADRERLMAELKGASPPHPLG